MNLPEGWIVPDWPVPANVRALITTRAGGKSVGPYAGWNFGDHVGDDPAAVTRNRARLRSLLPDEPIWLKQVHGTRVVEAVPESRGTEADASVAREPGRVCVVMSADCLPVLLADEAGTVVAVAHAGWRGLAAGVIERTMEAMRVASKSVLAYLGPAISGAAYEVGSDVVDAFTTVDAAAHAAFTPCGDGKFLADLPRLARERLRHAGCLRVYGGEFCTHDDAVQFYSYRRDGATGRMAALIWLDIP